MTMTDEYDEETCVTAGELRASGIEVPERIPDVAWIPRTTFLYEVGEVTQEGDVFVVPIQIQALEWRWIELRFEVPEET